MNRRELEVRCYPENSIVRDSKDTKEITVPVRRRKRETWEPSRLVVTYSQGL